MGNVVGSNTANILLVLGVPAILAGLHTSDCDTKKTYSFMILASLLFIGLAFTGEFTWMHGLVLLAALAFVLGDSFRDARRHQRAGEASPEEELEEADPDIPGWKIGLFLVLGLIGLPLGAELLVEGSTDIARDFGISETVIGLTLVAVGTSLPELATTVAAALRKQADVALGNVIGSNMFNLLAIIGIASFVGPIPVSQGILDFDLWIMLGASLVLAPFVFLKWNMGRVAGIALTGAYIAYLILLLA
jgi:cation:H+ antiporter